MPAANYGGGCLGGWRSGCGSISNWQTQSRSTGRKEEGVGKQSDSKKTKFRQNKQNERKAMKTINRIGKSWIWAAVALQLGLCAGAFAAERTAVPPDPYAPVWVRAMGDPAANVVVWIFYRAPENVPVDFNLLDLFDVNDRDGNGILDPWDCPFLMQGHQLFQEGVIMKASLQEIDEVPVWFTSFDEAIEVLMTTGTITIEQLEQMTSLVKGAATFYHEELHPSGGAMPVVKYNYGAKGSLENGRSFSVHIAGNDHYTPVHFKENTLFSIEFK
jgi:hypothetical protein